MEHSDKYAKEDWDDLFTLVRLGHYDVYDYSLEEAINFYNERYGEDIESIEEFNDSNDDGQLARLHDRISPMQSCAYSELSNDGYYTKKLVKA